MALAHPVSYIHPPLLFTYFVCLMLRSWAVMVVPSSTQEEMPRQGERHSCGVNLPHNPWISWPFSLSLREKSYISIHGAGRCFDYQWCV